MSRSIQLFLIASLTVLCSSVAFAGGNDDKPANVVVHVRDYCDPASFNAALNDPKACVRDTAPGAITFSGFLAEVIADKSVGAWRFVPARVHHDDGVNFTLENLGGETHTFTRVKKFGGGFVAPLNGASGNPIPAPECAKVVDGNLVPQPPGPNNIFLPAGTTMNGPHVGEDGAKFQCCIHPWMRITVNGDETHGDHQLGGH